MKGFLCFLMICVMTFSFILPTQPVLADVAPAELPKTNFIEQDRSKIDLNNANIKEFREVRGMYPTLGRIIIEHAPYRSLDDVLSIKGLTEKQKDLIRNGADRFTLRQPDESMNRERINNALYRL
ncbi:MAG: photosystem II oxygen evolving complex protein PsbU [Oscillatoriales cyanobacterium SM2_2_1]|nr:photosystem II oxygen evolving complex protein PsbU [Oscillatoriales cyanobacterium SM2_2_1]